MTYAQPCCTLWRVDNDDTDAALGCLIGLTTGLCLWLIFVLAVIYLTH